MAKEEQIKSQIILEGEKEYRAACKGINTSLREIGSEIPPPPLSEKLNGWG